MQKLYNVNLATEVDSRRICCVADLSVFGYKVYLQKSLQFSVLVETRKDLYIWPLSHSERRGGDGIKETEKGGFGSREGMK